MIDTISPRQIDILAIARDEGRVEVEPLADRFQVSPQTIRRDLNELCDKKMLRRVHGGAVFPSGVANYRYDARRVLAAEEKTWIGAAAAALIPDNSSLIVNIGTTTEQVAFALRRHQGLLVITNNIHVVNILQDSAGIEVIVAGGVVRKADGGIVGEATVDFLRQFKADYAIIGASAIDEDGSILDYDYREVRAAQAIIENARQPILVADSTKYQRTAPVRIGHISQMSCFVTDAPPPESLADICTESGVRVELATTDT
ncbi:MAG: DeoR/GlpR transcriptional regulator [Hyphomicrobiales bacterium]|nr:DeoR/GlpR transcriptional regulator [Hyphomicrobiales bacterium]